MFDGISFIKSSAANDGTQKNYAPMFRRVFTVPEVFQEATLRICGLGYAYPYLNGDKVTEDLFTAPVSDYNKTLWYTEYDVTALLKPGENLFAAICGNGWYNETITTPWDFHKASWRDTPKLILSLCVDGKQILCSDEQFRVSLESPVIYNQLRSGEHFDARLYDPNWNRMEYDDSNWEYAVLDHAPPKGVFRKCECESIREFEIYPTRNIIKLSEESYVFDIGQNISGYVRLYVNQKAGDVLRISYGEQLNGDNTLRDNEMKGMYPESEFQTDYFICNGKPFCWSPKFAYHGFRYIRIDGIENPDKNSVAGVFVHQDVALRSGFFSSDDTLNRLFRCGQISTWSNMFYQLTDCPTREKLGWMNDARASMDQILTNFCSERFLEKWLVDIWDAMNEDGMLPGIVPTSGWGFAKFSGPVCDGTLFELPYQIYLHTGSARALRESFPWFRRYLKMLDSREEENGDILFGLPDWAAVEHTRVVPLEFINDILRADFLRITALSARMNGLEEETYNHKRDALVQKIKGRYLDSDGRCTVNEQAAVAMLVYYDLYDELEPLKQQLLERTAELGGHHNCGMVGLRHLYLALNKCGLSDLALEILTSPEYPSQGWWMEQGATSLWEYWEDNRSRNHHMYSDFMSWAIKTVLGIAPSEDHPGYTEVEISPVFLSKLFFAKGWVETVSGRIEVAWRREDAEILLEIQVPAGMKARYEGKPLQTGHHIIRIAE